MVRVVEGVISFKFKTYFIRFLLIKFVYGLNVGCEEKKLKMVLSLKDNLKFD